MIFQPSAFPKKSDRARKTFASFASFAVQAVAVAALAVGRAGAAAEAAEAAKPAEMHYLHGMLLERRGDLSDAFKEYEEALKYAPDSAFISREAAELALELGAVDEAQALAEKVVSLEPGSADAHVLLGRVRWAHGDVDLAQQSFEQALKLDPKSADSIFSLSSLLSTRSPQKARRLLERFAEEDPSQAAEAQFQLAKIDLQEGQSGSAIGHLKQSIALEPDTDSLPARYALAQAYEAQHSTGAALGEYLEILKLEPDNVALIDHIGEIYVLQDDWPHAFEQFRQAKHTQNADPSANHWLSLYDEHEGDFGKAADTLKDSAALADDPALAMRLSYYLTQAGRLPEAVRVLEQAHERWPQNDQVAYFLALGYDDTKREADAVKLLRQVVALKPEYHDARYQLAVVLEKTGDIAGSEAQFRKLLAAQPDDASALNYLGYSLADRGMKLDEAEKMIEQAVALDPKNGAYQDSLGWVHYKLGRSTQAVADLQRALQLLPDDDTVWEHLGDAELAAGDQVGAWKAWKRSQSLAPADEESRAGAKALKLQRRFSREQLGGLLQDYLSGVEAGAVRLTGLCDVSAKIGPKRISFKAMVTFRAPDDLRLEVLGPLFTPVMRLELSGQDFQMDRLALPGVSQEEADSAARAALSSMRDFLSGRVFSLKPAVYRKRWWSRKRELLAGGWTERLDAGETLAVELRPPSGPVSRLALDGFGRESGRLVPRKLTASGRGFSFDVAFTDVKISLAPAAAPPAAPAADAQ